MKKSLVLAMAIAMGISASAFAANPFSDVPAGHWAYGSIAKLAAAGVVDGYGDGTYRGDRLMTRYEMAQIVARAMAKGANVDRLASEFADELDSLGVRVAKLEKKSDNVKVTGQVRYMYENVKVEKPGNATDNTYNHSLRSRIFLTGTVNDNWNYVGMLENNHSFANDMTSNKGLFNSVGDEANEGTAFQRAYLEGRLGGTKVTAGRWNQNLIDGILYSTRVDGINVAYGKQVKFNAFYVRPTNESKTDWDYDKAWGVNATGDLGKNVTLRAGYTKYTNSPETGFAYDNMGIWNAGIKFTTGQLGLGFDYLKSNYDVDDDLTNKGYVISATYAGAKAAKVGSYGIKAMYHHQGVGTFTSPSVFDDDQTVKGLYGQGFKGFSLRADYTIAKNMVLATEYYDFKGLDNSDYHNKTWAGHMMVTF